MGVNATFNATTKLITLTEVPTGSKVSLDAQVDLYSDAKEDWLSDAALNKHTICFNAFGGNDIGDGIAVGSYFFLRNDLGWRIRPYEDDHELTISGNLYPFDASLPLFTSTLGAYTVGIFLERSALTQTVNTFTQTDRDTIEGTNSLLPALL